jgi:hypothetical protein
MGVGLAFKSAKCAVVSFASGVLIDIDHLFDYYSNHGFTLQLKKMYDTFVAVNLRRIYIFLHSGELVIILWVLIYVFSLSNCWKAFAIGLTQHLILDQITNPISAFGYFLIYRAMRGFKKKHIMRDKGAKWST